MRGSAVVAFGAALLLGVLGPFGSGAALPAPAAPSEGLTLTATPRSGTAPLTVQFTLSVPNGTPPMVRWAFGDGTYLNGSGSSILHPSHVYEWAGTYACRATAVWPAGSVNATLPISVGSGNFTVAVAASRTAGVVPLTVWLNGSVTGGSGTFVSYLWSFGTGDSGSGLSVRYTFSVPGRFLVTLVVVDSANRSARSSVVIDATGGAAPSAGNRGAVPVQTLPIVLGITGLGAASFLASLWWVRRARRAGSSVLGIESSAPALAVDRAPRPRSPSDPETPGPGPPDLGPPTPALDAVTAGEGPAAVPTSPEGPAPVSSLPSRPVALTYQILRHLAGLPRLEGPQDVAGAEYTQAGIAEALSVGQSAVSRVLRRLVAAGAIEVSTRHVPGSSRRLRVYRLTDRGERLGRALREAPPLR